MAITVISSASASVAAAGPALAGTASTDGSPAGFADLLFSQLGNVLTSNLASASGDTPHEKPGADKKTPVEAPALATDPTLAYLLANPASPTPLPPSGETRIEPPPIQTIGQKITELATAALSTAQPATAPATAIPAAALAIAQTIGRDKAETEAEAKSQPPLQASTPQSLADPLSAPQAPALLATASSNTPARPDSRTAPGKMEAPARPGKPLATDSTLPIAPETTPPPLTSAPLTTPTLRETFVATPPPVSKQETLTANIAAETHPLPTAPENAQPATNITGQAAKPELTANPSQEIRTPLQASNWSHDFGEKIVWLSRQDQQQAHININPPQLGPVQISLQMNGDQLSASFASPHAEVRQAIESSLSQLKEMLSAAGVSLGQTNVGSQMAQQNREAPFQTANGNRFTNENAILLGIGNTVDSGISTPIQRGRGLVDLFA